MQFAANSASCPDHGGISRTPRSGSAKNPGRSNVTAPMQAMTRPTSAPSPAIPSRPAASTSLSGVPATYSRTMAGRTSALAAGTARSTAGTATCARARAMTAASMAGSGPPSRTTTRSPSASVSRQVSCENPPASGRASITVAPSASATASTSAVRTSPVSPNQEGRPGRRPHRREAISRRATAGLHAAAPRILVTRVTLVSITASAAPAGVVGFRRLGTAPGWPGWWITGLHPGHVA